MTWLLILIFQIVFNFQCSIATNCFVCVSPDKQYNATVRRQLATQTDVFFYPVGVKNIACSEYINPDESLFIEGQICGQGAMCVTLFPNLPNSTFVVRGCFESILRHYYRENEILQEPGCFLARSQPTFPNTIAMDYVICTCRGDYCNTMSIPDVVSPPYSFGSSRILRLDNPHGALQIVSGKTREFSAILLGLLPFFHFVYIFV